MTNDVIVYEVSNAVATIRLNRPDVLNALNHALMQSLYQAVSRADQDESVRAVILTGTGRAFSAGADLTARGDSATSQDSGKTLRECYHPVIERMRAMPKPIVSAVNGLAAGAGMSIALAGDIILAASSSYFLQAFSKIGLVPDAGSTYFLPRYVGEVRARAMAILADRVSAAEAQQFGMVWKVLPDAELIPEAQRMAAHLASMPTRAYALIKQTLNKSLDNDLSAQLEFEAQCQSIASKTEDFREGVAAFREKRPPRFQGR